MEKKNIILLPVNIEPMTPIINILSGVYYLIIYDNYY